MRAHHEMFYSYESIIIQNYVCWRPDLQWFLWYFDDMKMICQVEKVMKTMEWIHAKFENWSLSGNDSWEQLNDPILVGMALENSLPVLSHLNGNDACLVVMTSADIWHHKILLSTIASMEMMQSYIWQLYNEVLPHNVVAVRRLQVCSGCAYNCTVTNFWFCLYVVTM